MRKPVDLWTYCFYWSANILRNKWSNRMDITQAKTFSNAKINQGKRKTNKRYVQQGWYSSSYLGSSWYSLGRWAPYSDSVVITCRCQHFTLRGVPAHTVHGHLVAREYLDQSSILPIPYVDLPKVIRWKMCSIPLVLPNKWRARGGNSCWSGFLGCASMAWKPRTKIVFHSCWRLLSHLEKVTEVTTGHNFKFISEGYIAEFYDFPNSEDCTSKMSSSSFFINQIRKYNNIPFL